MSAFSSFLSFVFGWLPAGLYIPVVAVFSIAFLIVVVKILIAIVEVVTKLFALFLPI